MTENPVTARQREVLQFMHTRQSAHGSMPTMLEIARSLGLKSPNSAYEHVAALEKKGMVKLARGVSRGIQFTAEGRSFLGIGTPAPISGDHLIALPVVDMARVNLLARQARATS